MDKSISSFALEIFTEPALHLRFTLVYNIKMFDFIIAF
jgi:hypothetical protein